MRAIVVGDARLRGATALSRLWHVSQVTSISRAVELADSCKADAIVLARSTLVDDDFADITKIHLLAAAPLVVVVDNEWAIGEIESLEAGADDFVCSRKELLPRLFAVARRYHGFASSVIRSGDLEVDIETHRIRYGEREEIYVPTALFSAIEALLLRAGKFVSREFLADRYGIPGHLDMRSVDSNIRKVRDILRSVGCRTDHILTLYGVGYSWKHPEQPAQTQTAPSK
ncbi:MAG: winged helix-turn-helix domain-containing protein [Patescibacteria group bacterium]